MMRSYGLFLLLYLLGLCWGTSEALSHQSCPTGVTCAQMEPAEWFLQCVGLPSTDTGSDHLHRLHSVMEALMDIYTFMRTSVRGVPVLSLQGALDMRLTAEPLQNEALVHMWLEVKMKPLLHSVSKQLLSCLSFKNFSCSTYQLMVQELSVHFSDMDPVRQRWIYDFFMYPFLSRDDVAGCVDPQQNNVDWLMKNFGAFKAMAQMKDFSTLNMYFSGLEVLELLTPEQKARLLLSPEVAGLDNGTLHLVFNSMMGRPHPTTTSSPGTGPTGTGYIFTTAPSYDPYQMSTGQPSISQVVKGFMGAFKPISSFVHEFVSFANQRDVSQIRSTSLAQFLLNFTLSEVASMYKAPAPESAPDFNLASVEDWYLQVVVPVLHRFLPKEVLTQTNVSMAFYSLFYLEHGMNESTSELEDVCSLILDQGQCGLTDVVQDVAEVLHCAAQTDFTMTEENVLSLLTGLAQRSSSLLQELSSMDLHVVSADIRQIFSGTTSPALIQKHMSDPAFIQTWFRVKLLPLLPDVSPELMSCLSRKNFTCPAYHTIVRALSEHMDMMKARPEAGQNMYDNFIYPFLLLHNSSDTQCMSNSSALWLQQNFGFFSRFASITDFYLLNPFFSEVEVLFLLSPVQMAQLLLLPLPSPADKAVVVEQVFDFLLSAPISHFREVMQAVLTLAPQVNVSCPLYTQMLVRLYGSVPSVSPALEPEVWTSIEDLMNIAPQECVPENMTCPVIPFNGTEVCGRLNVSWSSPNISVGSMCDLPLEQYACPQLENFTAAHLASLLSCDLGGNSSHSRILWKLLLTRLSSILDPALDLLAAKQMASTGSSAPEILDVLGEIRVSMLMEQELQNPSLIHTWFSQRLRSFLPHASGRFLRCLSTRNLSCSSYQTILQIFSQDFEQMPLQQQRVVLKNYIVRFLFSPLSGPGCVSMNSSEWLRQNLGPFAGLLTLQHLLQLNPQLNPLDVLSLLTPEQSAQMLTLPLPTDKHTIINTLFDFYTQGPAKKHLPMFLSALTLSVPQGNLSCSDYRTLFNRLDLAIVSVSLATESIIIRTKMMLAPHVPHGCIIYEGECTVTLQNETEICAEVNSTFLQLLIDQGKISGLFCDFTVEQLACATLSALNVSDVVEILTCTRPQNSSGSRASWKLLLTKVPQALDQALDILANITLDPTQAAIPLILDAIREIRLDNFPMDQINHLLVIKLWFNSRLRPFLSFVSMDFLHCLTTKPLNCSTFEHIVHSLSLQQPHMALSTQMYIYTHFIRVYLSRNNTQDPSCSANTNSSVAWLRANLGAFSGLASFKDLRTLNPAFSAMDSLAILSVRQLAEVSSTPGQLSSPTQVAMVMSYVPNQLLMPFFEDYSSAVLGSESQYPAPVRSAILQVVFDRANLSQPSVPDSELLEWLDLLPPLLVNLSPAHVGPFFSIVSGRACSIKQLAVMDLNSTISSLSEQTKRDIYQHIMLDLQGPVPLRCYGNNYNHSFYGFLESTFMGFQFPNLTSILSLMPQQQMLQLLDSMSVSELGQLLWRPGVVDSEAALCQVYSSYTDTALFLQSEPLPLSVEQVTLSCVWPWALRSATPAEADKWFDQTLQRYLRLLTKKDLSPSVTYNSSCVAFRKLVAVMGQHNYSGTDLDRRDMFTSIQVFLKSASAPRCYSPTDPLLNSTAWFAQYIGPFFGFMTLGDFLMFGSVQVFTVNPQNIALLNHSALPQNLTDYYTELVYEQDSSFNPLLLPLLCRCVAPGPAFSQLTANQSIIVLHNLTTLCTDLDPQVAAALAENFGDKIDASTLETLGKENVGLSMGQIKTIPAKDLLLALGTLSEVSGWNQGQARAIVQAMMSSGVMKVSSASSLMKLGTLLMGVPSSVIGDIKGAELLTASKNPAFLQNIMSASTVIQETFVLQLIGLNSSSEAIMENVPDDMAGEVPRVLLVTMSSSSTVLKEVNKKKWKSSQVELFFNVVAVDTAAIILGGTNNLSSSVLQGFSCTNVRTFQKTHINNLIKACRRKGKEKVTLVESQLTCMSYYMQDSSDVTNFSLIPPDVLLYYRYSSVPSSRCRDYFEQLAEADFSVFSSDLSYMKAQLFTNARICLGINSTRLTQDQVSVLGNMCCTLEGSYIQNSDPSILEKLKNCPDLTEDQAAAVQTLLESGNTLYGPPSTWDVQTLKDLGMLPLYLQTSFYQHFDKKTKKRFLKYFLKVLKSREVPRSQRRALKEYIRESMKGRRRRAASCMVGEITQVTISDETFPFDYTDVQQFNSCLSATTVKNNLDALTTKVDVEDYLRVLLDKLNEAYMFSSPLHIPEEQVQVLGLASRLATEQDISHWTITQLDTLSALMNPSDGQWNASLAQQVISRYLSTPGNSLGSAELNAVGGNNLCSLEPQVLKNISPQSLRDADKLTVSVCSTLKKQALFSVALQAFSSSSSSSTRSAEPVSKYQLMQPYLGGANESYVKSLVYSDVNMDVPTFTTLETSVAQSLSVNDVRSLLGSNLNELKSYENTSAVQDWIRVQYQSDLNTLNIGLKGGQTSPISNSTSAPGATNSTSAPGASNSTSAPGASNSTSAPGASNSTSAPGASNSTSAPGASNSTSAPGASNSTSAPGASTTRPGPTAAPSAGTTTTTQPSNTVSTTAKPSHGVSLSAPSGLCLVLLLLLCSSQHMFS